MTHLESKSELRPLFRIRNRDLRDKGSGGSHHDILAGLFTAQQLIYKTRQVANSIDFHYTDPQFRMDAQMIGSIRVEYKKTRFNVSQITPTIPWTDHPLEKYPKDEMNPD